MPDPDQFAPTEAEVRIMVPEQVLAPVGLLATMVPPHTVESSSGSMIQDGLRPSRNAASVIAVSLSEGASPVGGESTTMLPATFERLLPSLGECRMAYGRIKPRRHSIVVVTGARFGDDEEKKKKEEERQNALLVTPSHEATTPCQADGTLAQSPVWTEHGKKLPPCIKFCIEEHEAIHAGDADLAAACKKYRDAKRKAGESRQAANNPHGSASDKKSRRDQAAADQAAADKAVAEWADAVKASERKAHKASVECFRKAPSCCASAKRYQDYSVKLAKEKCHDEKNK